MRLYLFLIFIILNLFYSFHCAYIIIEKEEFYEKQKKDKRGIEYYNRVIDNLKKILNYYVYIELYKNPPQPSFDDNYFPKIDILSQLEIIRSEITNETYYYEFYRKIKFLIDSLKDAHMSYGLRGFSFDYYLLCPIKLMTKTYENGTVYMTGEIAFNNDTYFKNGSEIFPIINKNIGNPIYKINGKNPFDFIQNFGGNFFNLKNKQANYAFKTHQYLSPFILYFPFNENELLFNVEYINGDKFETEYAIAQTISTGNNLNYFFNDINKDKEFMQYLYDHFMNNFYYPPKGLIEILNDFDKYKNNKNKFNYENILSEKDYEFSNIIWDYEYIQGNKKIFQCRIDTINNLDVIHMPTFDFQNLTLILELLKNCTKLFDTNNNNIVVILDFNGGGIERVAQTMIEFIQPHITSRFYSTFKHGDYLDKYYDINFEDHSIIETCKIPDKKYILDNIITIDYGKGVINNVTKPLRRFGQYREEYNEFKKSLKNKRKPNEILIFTDGYSASSASLFTKSLQNEGGAIIVGYNGNPISNDIFDASQHFSTIFSISDLKIMEKELMEEMIADGIYFSQICKTNNLFDYREIKVPEEFNIMEVDEVSNIYEKYDEDTNYNLFMNKANKYFEKYKTKCNINNTRMTLFDENCTFPEDKFAHGGHPCNKEGIWDLNKCQKVYCDEGYFLDFKEYKCVKDPCLSKDEHSDEESDNFGIINRINLIILGMIFLNLIL